MDDEQRTAIIPLSGFAASEVLYDTTGRSVQGVATKDAGIGKDGRQKDSFARGVELLARQTLFAEGARGRRLLYNNVNPYIPSIDVNTPSQTRPWPFASHLVSPHAFPLNTCSTTPRQLLRGSDRQVSSTRARRARCAVVRPRHQGGVASARTHLPQRHCSAHSRLPPAELPLERRLRRHLPLPHGAQSGELNHHRRHSQGKTIINIVIVITINFMLNVFYVI